MSAKIVKKYKHKKQTPKPKFTTTTNGALAYTSTGDARVDLFYHTARGIQTEQLVQLLNLSWAQSPLDTLKIIFYNRDCRGGKGEKEIFKTSIEWLHTQSPSTLAKNFPMIPHFGSWKDVSKLIGTDVEPLALESLAKQLEKDLAVLQSAETEKNISLCAKWAPSEGKQNDVQAKAAKKLATILSVNRKTAKKEYRQKYLTPLRKYLKLVESKMSANEWSKIEYSKVPSRCMKLQRKAFERHDPEGFSKFTEKLVKGETKVNAKQLFPHEIIKEYLAGKAQDVILEEQWKVLEEETRKLGVLEDCIVLSDVSGSMSGTPMEVSIALGILISGLTRAPFKDLVITFAENPEFHQVSGNTLKDRVDNLKCAAWGGSTNFNKVFTMILEKAVKNKLPASAMPKKLFVISDMQFNVADSSYQETNHQNLVRQYTEAGYQVPQMIYWNVNGANTSTPVGSANIGGVGLVSGFSPSILKAIINAGDTTTLTPLSLLQPVLDDKRYADLVI